MWLNGMESYGHVRYRDDSHVTRTVQDMEIEGTCDPEEDQHKDMSNIRRDIKKNGLRTSTFVTAGTGEW